MTDHCPPGLAQQQLEARQKARLLTIVFAFGVGFILLLSYHLYIGPPPTSPCWEKVAPTIPHFMHPYVRDMINEGCLSGSQAIAT